jgi:ribonuclease Z
MKIPIKFLGTGQAIPTKSRNHQGILMSYKDESILVDCGEGIQRQFRIAKENPCKITRVLITHFHGDHVLGLPGLFQTLALNNYSKDLYLYCPKKTKKYIKEIMKTYVPIGKIKIKVKEVEGVFFQNSDFELIAVPVYHNTPCNAYIFKEKDKLRIDKNKLNKLKIKNQKDLRKLIEGKDIILDNKNIKSSELTYLQKGKKISFLLDTGLGPNLGKILNNADLAIIESTYMDNESDLAKKFKHMTAKDAGKLAKENNVKKLVLTHISQRYEKLEDKLLSEAKKEFKDVILAYDLMKLEI